MPYAVSPIQTFTLAIPLTCNILPMHLRSHSTRHLGISHSWLRKTPTGKHNPQFEAGAHSSNSHGLLKALMITLITRVLVAF